MTFLKVKVDSCCFRRILWMTRLEAARREQVRWLRHLDVSSTVERRDCRLSTASMGGSGFAGVRGPGRIGRIHETHIPTEHQETTQEAWVQSPDENARGTRCHSVSPPQGTKPPGCVTGTTSRHRDARLGLLLCAPAADR